MQPRAHPEGAGSRLLHLNSSYLSSPAAAGADGAGSVSDVLMTGLKRFERPTADTDVYQKGVYAWQPSVVRVPALVGTLSRAMWSGYAG